MKNLSVMEFDKENTYVNVGCTFSMYKPKASSKVLKILEDRLGIDKEYTKCCRIDQKLEKEITLINVCAGCSENVVDKEEINSITLWEVLDGIEDLPLPNHSGLTVSIHDSCSYRKQPHIYKNVRSLLAKMNIEVIEAESHSEKTICCGRSMGSKLSMEQLYEQQKKRAKQMPCQDVVTYCSICTKAMANGDKTPHHLLDLILNEETDAGELDLMKHGTLLNQYKEENQRMSF